MGEFKDFKNWEYLRTTPQYARGFFWAVMGRLGGSEDAEEDKIFKLANEKAKDKVFKNAAEVIKFFEECGFKITPEFMEQFEQDNEWWEKNSDITEDDLRKAFGLNTNSGDLQNKKTKPS
jgi:hypothetical protein